MRFNREDYGSRIRSLRKKRGLTQEQLAEKMNVSTPYIAKSKPESKLAQSSWP